MMELDTDRLKHTRVMAHIDLDAFYAQVEQNRNPRLKDVPVAVIQYNPYGDLKTYSEKDERIFNNSHGSIIAISYGEARNKGVKRGMRGKEARALCPSLQLVQVPTLNGKADLTLYRRHGQEVLNVLAEADHTCGVVCEKASIDESYLDVTDAAMARLQQQQHPWSNLSMLPEGVDKMHVGCVGGCGEGVDGVLGGREWLSRPAEEWDMEDLLLAHGAAIIAEKRAKVFQKLGYTVSAGVAHTKLLAKLCSGLNKPNKQTVVPQGSVATLLHDLPLEKLRGLGGDLGRSLQSTLGVDKVGDVVKLPLEQLQRDIGEEKGMWLYRMARGQDGESVTPRTAPKSIGCGKTFRGRLLIKSAEEAKGWLGNLTNEIHARLEEDHNEHARLATRLVLAIGCSGTYKSMGTALHHHTASALAEVAGRLFHKWEAKAERGWAVSGLSLTASGFCTATARNSDVRSLLTAGARRKPAAEHLSKPPVGVLYSEATLPAHQAAARTIGAASQGAIQPDGGEGACGGRLDGVRLSEGGAPLWQEGVDASTFEGAAPDEMAAWQRHLGSMVPPCADSQQLQHGQTESASVQSTTVCHRACTHPFTPQEHTDSEKYHGQASCELHCDFRAQDPHDLCVSSSDAEDVKCDRQTPSGREPPWSAGAHPHGHAHGQHIGSTLPSAIPEDLEGRAPQQQAATICDSRHDIHDENTPPAKLAAATMVHGSERRPCGWDSERLSFNDNSFVPKRISAVDLASLPADIRSELYLAQGRVGAAGELEGGTACPRKKVPRTAGSTKASVPQRGQKDPQQSIQRFFGASRSKSIGGT